jgi:hypothetical protein
VPADRAAFVVSAQDVYAAFVIVVCSEFRGDRHGRERARLARLFRERSRFPCCNYFRDFEAGFFDLVESDFEDGFEVLDSSSTVAPLRVEDPGMVTDVE